VVVTVGIGWLLGHNFLRTQIESVEERRWAELTDAEARAASLLARSLAIERAPNLAQEGRVDDALLALLDAAHDLSDASAPQALRISFERVLQRAQGETRHRVPPGATPLIVNQQMWLHDTNSGQLWRVSDDQGPIEQSRIPGRAYAIAEVDRIDGVVLLMHDAQSLTLFAVSDSSPPQVLAQVDGWTHVQPLDLLFGGFEHYITINRDGFALIKSPDGSRDAVLVNLRTGESQRTSVHNFATLSLPIDDQGRSYVFGGFTDFDVDEGITEEALTVGPRVEFDFFFEDHLRACFQEHLTDPFLPIVIEYLIGAGIDFDPLGGYGMIGRFSQGGCRVVGSLAVLNSLWGGTRGDGRTTEVQLLSPTVFGAEGGFRWDTQRRLFGNDILTNPAMMEIRLPETPEGAGHGLGLVVEADGRSLNWVSGWAGVSRQLRDRRTDRPIVAVSGSSQRTLAVLTETRGDEGRMLSLTRIDQSPWDSSLIPTLSHVTTVPWPDEPVTGAEAGFRALFPGAVHPVFEPSGHPGFGEFQTGSGVVSLSPLPNGALQIRLETPDGMVHGGPLILAEFVGVGRLSISPDASRVAWFHQDQVRIFESGVITHPLLTLPRDAYSVRFYRNGPQVIVADGETEVRFWTPGTSEWSSALAYAADTRVLDIDSTPNGWWLLVSRFDRGAVFFDLVDFETGTLAREIATSGPYSSGWFTSDDRLTIAGRAGHSHVELPTLSEYRTRAVEALRGECRIAEGQSWQASRCWPRG